MTTVLVNGRDDDQLPVADRGLQFGDGLFETLPVCQGETLWFDQHYQRLQDGCQRLKIPLPEAELWRTDIHKLAANKQRAVIKMMITRGTSQRGYKTDEQSRVTRVVSCSAWKKPPEDNILEGIRLKLCTTPVSHHPLLGSIKHLNRLENVMARQEWQGNEYDEGLMCDLSGNVIEGIMSNIFICKEKRLTTPMIDTAGVKGIMRNWILEQRADWQVEEVEQMTPEEVMNADEIFICNSLIGLWPVREFNHVHYRPGPVFNHLYQKLLEIYPVLQ